MWTVVDLLIEAEVLRILMPDFLVGFEKHSVFLHFFFRMEKVSSIEGFVEITFVLWMDNFSSDEEVVQLRDDKLFQRLEERDSEQTSWPWLQYICCM